MLARLTATTDLTGLPAECLSAPARGMAGDAVGVGVVGAMDAAAGATAGVDMATDEADMATDGVATATVAGMPADADTRMVRLAGTTERLVVGFMAALSATAVEGSTVAAAGSTVVAVGTAAVVDTGNRRGSGVS
jgi:hypothetical protein